MTNVIVFRIISREVYRVQIPLENLPTPHLQRNLAAPNPVAIAAIDKFKIISTPRVPNCFV
jgi:hypothetical protein